MAESRDNKGKPQLPQWPIEPSPKPGEGEHRAGRIVHDERGNAVWNWVKETGRFCIDSTSALLKKLDFGDLRVEGENESGLKLDDPGRDAGGGYDPYNQKIVPKKTKPLPPKK